MIFHLSSAPHNVTTGRFINSVARPACNVHRFQNMNMGPRHLTVSYQKTGRRQRSKSAAYDIRVFLFHAFRHLRSCKRLIISVAVIYALAVLTVFSKFGIPIIAVHFCVLSFPFSTVGFSVLSCRFSALSLFIHDKRRRSCSRHYRNAEFCTFLRHM